MKKEEQYLPSHIIKKAIRSGNEYSWKRSDFVEVLDTALDVGLGIIGGQMQFKLPDGTCEMYWHKYDTNDRIAGESWKEYCTRTHSECLKQFKAIPSNSELVKEGVECFDFLRKKSEAGIDLDQYIVFILYFNDLETFLEDVN